MTPLETLREALTGWRKTRHPRFAAVVQWASERAVGESPRPLVGAGKKQADLDAWNTLLSGGDPLDLPRLLGALGKMKSADAAASVGLLSKQNDPRVTDGVLALLSQPPWRARTALPFFRACARVLGEAGEGDRRVRPALEDLASRYKSIVETSVGDDITALLRRTAESLDQVKPGPLSAAWEAKCAALEKDFETERTRAQRGLASSQSAKHSDEGLLAAIYASPDEDAPRLVFADALIERGDLRGEFISLQLNRAKGKASPAQLVRERELCADPKKKAAWSQPLSQGGVSHVARGFPDELMLEARTFKTVIGNPALRTLHTVTGFDRELSINQAKAFLGHENAVLVRTVRSLRRELFDALEALPWPSVALSFLPERGDLVRLPNLRELQVWSVHDPLSPSTFVGLERLEKLMAGVVDAPTLAPLTGLLELHVVQRREDLVWTQLLAAQQKLQRLTLGSSLHAAQVEGLKLRSLTCRYAPQLEPDAVIGALPQLEELHLVTGGSSVPTAASRLITAPRLRQLRFATADGYELTAPFTPQGKLELRTWNRLDYQVHAGPVGLLPEGCVTKVLVRPQRADPWIAAGPPPSEEAVAAIRAAARVPVELAWY